MKQKNYTNINHLVKPKTTAPKYGKETEPIISNSEVVEVQEVVEQAVDDEEVKKHVEIKPETIKLPSDLKKLGVQTSSHIQFPNYKNIKLPIPDEEVATGLNEPITSSWRWLAEFAKYILKQAHLTLKKVHGKIVRVKDY